MNEFIDTYREHCDHEMGRYPNDFAAAFASSQRDGYKTDRSKIQTLVASGKFVFAREHMECCPHTDATLGVSQHLISVHDSLAEAQAAMAPLSDAWGEYENPYIIVKPPTPPSAPGFISVEDLYGDIPF